MHSSYWGINGNSRPEVLAEKRGMAVLSADRTSCGEAYRCAPSQTHFQVTVVVT